MLSIGKKGNKMKWVLLDFDGLPIRYYNYPAKGTIEIKEQRLSYNELLNLVGEALF